METRHALEATYKPDLRLARCGRLGASQRALVDEWEACAWVLGSLALIAGASLAAGAPLQAGFYLLLGLLLLEPLALSRISARARHFGAAALFAGIAVLMDALLILLLIGLPVEGLGMLTRVLSTAFLAAAGLHTAIAVKDFQQVAKGELLPSIGPGLEVFPNPSPGRPRLP